MSETFSSSYCNSSMCHFLINSIIKRPGILNLKSGLIKLSMLYLDLQWLPVSTH